MKTTRRLLAAFIMTLLFTFCYGSVAYASELTEEAAELSDTETAEQELVLEEGYYIDEQGQICYDPSRIEIEEPVIEDIPEEDIEDTDDIDNTSTVEDTKEASTQASKEETKDDTKEDSKEDTKDDTKEDTQPAVKEPSKQNAADNTKETSLKADKQKTQNPEPVTAAPKPSYTDAELRLLSSLIYAEAGGQTYSGMLAVANVVLNRVKSDVYWHVDTIKEVIYDHKWSVQFSVTIKNGKTGLSMLDKALKCYDTGTYSGPNPEAEKKAMARAIKAAKAALNGKNNIGSYLCFTNKRSSGSIKKKYPDYKIIDDQIFYRSE